MKFLHATLIFKMLSVYLTRRKITGKNKIDREELKIALLFLCKRDILVVVCH